MRSINYLRIRKVKVKPIYTQRVVNYAISLSYKDIPPDVVQGTKFTILNALGCALAASKYEHSKAIVDYVREQGGNEESSVVGNNFKTSAVNAAFANGSMPYILDLDGHGVDVGVWAGLAVGEKLGVSGKDFITATVAGFDIHKRVGNATRLTSMYNRRFHHSAICGCFNGTVAAGKLLGLDKGKFTNALGLAGMTASSLMAWLTDPTEMSRSLSPGLGARNATTAALLAKAGYAGPPTIFDGQWSVFDAFSGNYDREELTKDLGKTFKIFRAVFAPGVKSDVFMPVFKVHTCCGSHHEAIDALLKMMHERNIMPEDIKKITVRTVPWRVPIICDVAPRSHNIMYTMAVAAFDRKITAKNILEENRLKDPRVLELSKHVNLISDPKLSGVSVIVEVVTKAGAKYVERLDRSTTWTHHSKEELEQHFMNLATTAVSVPQAKSILKLVDELEKIEDIRKLGDLLRIQ